MSKIRRRILMFTVFLMLAAVSFPASASDDRVQMQIISCPEQNFATLVSPDYVYSYTPDGGLTIYLDENADEPCFTIFKTDAPGSMFNAEAYFENTYTPLIEGTYGNDLGDAGSFDEYEVAGKTMPGQMCFFQSGGLTGIRFCLFDLEDDYFVRYEVFGNENTAQDAINAMAVAAGNLKPDAWYYSPDDRPAAESAEVPAPGSTEGTDVIAGPDSQEPDSGPEPENGPDEESGTDAGTGQDTDSGPDGRNGYTVNQVRYQFEHSMLRRYFYDKPGTVIDYLENYGLYNLWESVATENGVDVTWTPEDYVLRMYLYGTTVIEQVDLPEPDESTLCWRIYLLHDESTGEAGYYTIEHETLLGPCICVCMWTPEGDHINYGDMSIPDRSSPDYEDELYEELKIVCSLFTGDEDPSPIPPANSTEDPDEFPDDISVASTTDDFHPYPVTELFGLSENDISKIENAEIRGVLEPAEGGPSVPLDGADLEWVRDLVLNGTVLEERTSGSTAASTLFGFYDSSGELLLSVTIRTGLLELGDKQYLVEH